MPDDLEDRVAADQAAADRLEAEWAASPHPPPYDPVYGRMRQLVDLLREVVE
jgi:hypothetical protein